MKFPQNTNSIIKYSLCLSILTLLISFLVNNVSKEIANDYLILELLSFPVNFAFLFAYFSGDTAFYFVCFLELIVLFVNFCMIFYFIDKFKKQKNQYLS